mgnify:CR=1 FL=1
MNKDVEQHLEELIEFYKNANISDIEYLKKLFVRNLGDVKRRYIKYDKPRKENIARALNKIDNMFDKGNENSIIDDLLELEKILKGSDSNVRMEN